MSTTEKPLFIANRRFDASQGEYWLNYWNWMKVPGQVEVVTLDTLLCPRLLDTSDFSNEDWSHIVTEDYRLDYFQDYSYLLKRTEGIPRRNFLGLYRNTSAHIEVAPGPGDFEFKGYDLVEEETGISALTNCGGFPLAFDPHEVNGVGLITSFDRAVEVRRLLATHYPNEHHAQCEMYAIWRLNSVDGGETSRLQP